MILTQELWAKALELEQEYREKGRKFGRPKIQEVLGVPDNFNKVIRAFYI